MKEVRFFGKLIATWGYKTGKLFLETRKGKLGYRLEFNIEDPNHPTLTVMPL